MKFIVALSCILFSFSVYAETFALLAHNGKFVTARPDGKLDANSSHVRGWEKFELLDLGDGKVALGTYHDTYISAFDGGGDVLNNKAPHIKNWETFKIIRLDGNKVAFQTYNGKHYINVALHEDSKKLTAKAPHIRGWETFTLVKP
jgi:hypothetical protein